MSRAAARRWSKPHVSFRPPSTTRGSPSTAHRPGRPRPGPHPRPDRPGSGRRRGHIPHGRTHRDRPSARHVIAAAASSSQCCYVWPAIQAAGSSRICRLGRELIPDLLRLTQRGRVHSLIVCHYLALKEVASHADDRGGLCCGVRNGKGFTEDRDGSLPLSYGR